jgi:hypothetical protein
MSMSIDCISYTVEEVDDRFWAPALTSLRATSTIASMNFVIALTAAVTTLPALPIPSTKATIIFVPALDHLPRLSEIAFSNRVRMLRPAVAILTRLSAIAP